MTLIKQAKLENLTELVTLFDQYRQFYEKISDIERAKVFLMERFNHKDSVIFMAWNSNQAVGFTQLYPLFSSVQTENMWLLNDLFVAEPYRKQGIAKLLMAKAKDHARITKACGVALSTQITNTKAQALYESLGYQKDTENYYYWLPLSM